MASLQATMAPKKPDGTAKKNGINKMALPTWNTNILALVYSTSMLGVLLTMHELLIKIKSSMLHNGKTNRITPQLQIRTHTGIVHSTSLFN